MTFQKEGNMLPIQGCQVQLISGFPAESPLIRPEDLLSLHAHITPVIAQPAGAGGPAVHIKLPGQNMAVAYAEFKADPLGPAVSVQIHQESSVVAAYGFSFI